MRLGDETAFLHFASFQGEILHGLNYSHEQVWSRPEFVPRAFFSPACLFACKCLQTCKHPRRKMANAFSDWLTSGVMKMQLVKSFTSVTKRQTFLRVADMFVVSVRARCLMIISACDFKKGHDLVSCRREEEGGEQLWNGIFRVIVWKYFAEREAVWARWNDSIVLPTVLRVSQLLSLGKRECGRTERAKLILVPPVAAIKARSIGKSKRWERRRRGIKAGTFTCAFKKLKFSCFVVESKWI